MEINDRVKELIKYWAKGFVIITGVMMVITLINISVNEEIITQFWQGFIVASTGFIYTQRYQQRKKNERILEVIEEIESLVDKYEDLDKQEEMIDKRLEEIRKEREELLNKDTEDEDIK